MNTRHIENNFYRLEIDDECGRLDRDMEINLTFLPAESKLLVFDAENRVTAALRRTLVFSASVALNSWKLKLPHGQDVQLKPEMPSWDELGWPEHSGFMRYHTEFRWEKGTSSADLEKAFKFKGTYAPIYKKLDMQKLRSGLFGPVSLIPVVR